MLEYKQEENKTKSVFITLLEVYAKYKLELFDPAINEHDVWNKIVNEMRAKCNLNSDELECRNKIEELRRDYERVKNRSATSQDVVEFLNAAEEAFRTSECLSKSSSSCSQKYDKQRRERRYDKQRRERRLEALRVYNTYKDELFLPKVSKASVWKKMAERVRQNCSLNEGSYGLQHFHSQMLSLKHEYERKINNTLCLTNPNEATFLKEARLAFGDDSKFPADPSKLLSDGKCSRKYRQKQARRFAALKVYNMYKKELSLPGVNTTNVWKKIVETVRQKYSLKKSKYGLTHFHAQILSFLHEYKKEEDLKSNVITPYMDMFLKEARLAFEDPEFPVHLEQINHLATGINR